jgi:hypothetical protein
MTNTHDFEVEYDGDPDRPIIRQTQSKSSHARTLTRDDFDQERDAARYRPHTYHPEHYRPPFRVPAIVNTGLTLTIAAVIFFGMERYAPHDLKPSTNVGGFEASVGAQMKAAEVNEQARFASFEGEMKLAVETQAKQNEMLLQSILQHYQAVYDRAKMMTEAANTYQGKYLDARIRQVDAIQSTDTAVVSIARLAGRGLNLLEPGSGDEALEYADNITEGLEAGLTKAAQEGVRVDMTGWNYGIAAPTEIQAMMASVRPTQLPKPPNLARHYQSTPPPADSKAR